MENKMKVAPILCNVFSSTVSAGSDAEHISKLRSSQSPIAIALQRCPTWSSLDPLQFKGYWDNKSNGVLLNTGQTAYFTFEASAERPRLSGGPLIGEYIFEQMHFHWSVDDYTGCEHVLDGQGPKEIINKNNFYYGTNIENEYKISLRSIISGFSYKWRKAYRKFIWETKHLFYYFDVSPIVKVVYIDGLNHEHSYAAECHFVHYNSKYASMEAAVGHPDGLAVVGFLLEASNVPNPKFDKLVTALDNIKKRENAVPINAESLSWMQREDLHKGSYVTYKGSLTTPPYTECVTWIIYEKPLQIGSGQLELLRQLEGLDSLPIERNVRPTQKHPPGHSVIYVKQVKAKL